MSKDSPASRFYTHRADLWEGDPFLLPESRRRAVHYIEAACREARSLSEGEDCYELGLFRLFRDEFVVERTDSEIDLAGYREEAVRISRAIERLPAGMSQEVYLSIYERGVAPTVALILSGKWDEAYEAHKGMHRDLKARFLERGRQKRAAGGMDPELETS